MRATLYCLIDKFEYKDGIFGAGVVKNSIHPADKVFLQIYDNIFELRDDEIHAIISSLGKVLWCNYQYAKKDKVKLSWLTLEQLRKKYRGQADRKRKR